MKPLAVLLGCFLLAGCASAHRNAGDPDRSRQVCPSTEIGREPKTFCY